MTTPKEDRPGDAGLSLWWGSLDVSSSRLRDLTASLSPEELQRAVGFHRPLDRARFLAARGWLRRVLARELRCAPGDVPIVTGELGKPRLSRSELCFSASRSEGVALYATSWRMDVGVDVEAIEPTADVDRIAAKFFTTAEQRALFALSPAQRLVAFFQCWTRKEAYVKGIGAGLGFPLDTVDVWAGGAQRAIVTGWSIYQVDVAPGFAAAVAGANLDERAPSAPRDLLCTAQSG